MTPVYSLHRYFDLKLFLASHTGIKTAIQLIKNWRMNEKKTVGIAFWPNWTELISHEFCNALYLWKWCHLETYMWNKIETPCINFFFKNETTTCICFILLTCSFGLKYRSVNYNIIRNSLKLWKYLPSFWKWFHFAHFIFIFEPYMALESNDQIVENFSFHLWDTLSACCAIVLLGVMIVFLLLVE